MNERKGGAIMCDEKERNTKKNKDLRFWDIVAKEVEQSEIEDDESKIWENEVGSFYAEIEESEERQLKEVKKREQDDTGFTNTDDIDWDDL
jgi:rRNA maturation endonuclease Nob1